MKVKTARDVAKSLLVDVDAIICGEQRPEEDRHTAQASAAVLVVRLFGGVCINMARIADALDKRDTGKEEEESRATETKKRNGARRGARLAKKSWCASKITGATGRPRAFSPAREERRDERTP